MMAPLGIAWPSVTGGGDWRTLSPPMTILSSCEGERMAGDVAPEAEGERRDRWAYDDERGSDGRLDAALLLLRGRAGRMEAAAEALSDWIEGRRLTSGVEGADEAGDRAGGV
jgi:hypothetical protein